MHRLQQGSKVVGSKQTKKALDKGIVEVLFIAEDAQQHQISSLVNYALRNQINIVYVPSMDELGRACDVDVKTATAALIVNN